MKVHGNLDHEGSLAEGGFGREASTRGAAGKSVPSV